MFTISLDSATDWVNQNNVVVPRSIDIACPYCGRLVNFTCRVWHTSNGHGYVAASCPGCGERVSFFAMEPVLRPNDGDRCAELCMHPSPRFQRQPMEGVDELPERVSNAYGTVITAFNSGQYSAAGVLIGRTLEGLLQDLLTRESALPDRPTLNNMLQALPGAIDLSQNLQLLTDGLRRGRNLGAHFDIQKEVDAETAQLMVDFLEYFIEYLYVLPHRIQQLHDRV